jgi:hypothetical protein
MLLSSFSFEFFSTTRRSSLPKIYSHVSGFSSDPSRILLLASRLCHAATLSTGTVTHIHIMTEQRRILGTEDKIRYERRALSIRSKHHYIHPMSI